jgi:hypothetical protein
VSKRKATVQPTSGDGRGGLRRRASSSLHEVVGALPAAREAGEAGLRSRGAQALEPLELLRRDDRGDGAPAAGDDHGHAVLGAANVRRQLVAGLGDGDLLGHVGLLMAIMPRTLR